MGKSDQVNLTHFNRDALRAQHFDQDDSRLENPIRGLDAFDALVASVIAWIDLIQ